MAREQGLAPQSRGAQKRAEILAVAAQIFMAEGYGRTSMDRVHSQIGGSKRTLYSHFPTKDALFEAIIQDVSERALAGLKPPQDGQGMGDVLFDVGLSYLTVLLSHDGLRLYRAVISEAPHFPQLARAFFENGPGRASRYLAVFFREQKAQGLIDIGDPQIAAEHFLGAVRGDLHLMAGLGVGEPSAQMIESTVRQAADVFMRGICVRAPHTCDQ